MLAKGPEQQNKMRAPNPLQDLDVQKSGISNQVRRPLSIALSFSLPCAPILKLRYIPYPPILRPDFDYYCAISSLSFPIQVFGHWVACKPAHIVDHEWPNYACHTPYPGVDCRVYKGLQPPKLKEQCELSYRLQQKSHFVDWIAWFPPCELCRRNLNCGSCLRRFNCLVSLERFNCIVSIVTDTNADYKCGHCG